MKAKMFGIILKGFVIALVLVMVPIMASAMGNSEKTYPEVLEAEFNGIAEGLEAGEINRVEALERLNTVRTDYGREYNEDYQTMEGLMLKVMAHEMTALQAKEQMKLLAECQEENAGIKLQQKEQNKTQLKTQNTTQTQVRTQSQTSTESRTGSSSSGGSSSGSSSGGSDKSKSKK